MLLLGMPKKYQPDFPFLRAIPTSRVNANMNLFSKMIRILGQERGQQCIAMFVCMFDLSLIIKKRSGNVDLQPVFST